MNINTTYIDRQPALENNSSGLLTFTELCLSDAATVQVRWAQIVREMTLELLLTVVDEKTLLAHLLSKGVSQLDIWARFKDEPLEALTSGPRSFLLEVTKFGPLIAEELWNTHKLAVTSDMLQTDDEETSPAYHFVVHEKHAIVDELLRQVPRVFTKCEKTMQILEGRPDEWKKFIGRIHARNALFAELDRLAAKEQITADDIKRAECIASQANFASYHNSFFDLAELLAEKPGCREAALDMYGMVVHASWNRESVYEILASAYQELAREAGGEDALRLIKKALQVAINMQKSDREEAIQQIASVYLNQSIEEKRIVPQHTFDLISQAEHIPAEWVLHEFDRIKKRLILEAEVEALKAQNTALHRRQDELFCQLEQQKGNK